jgi:hypothetical protein
VVRRKGTKLEVAFGDPRWGLVVTEARASRGVLVFTSGVMPSDECDAPGCGNLLKVSGVIYPVAENGKWVPQIKATYTIECPYPDDPEAPRGEVRTTQRMKKQ